MSEDFEARLRHALQQQAQQAEAGVEDPVADVRRRARRQTRTQWTLAMAGVVVVLALAGGLVAPMLRGDMAVEFDPGPVDQPPEAPAELGSTCRNPADGYRISYPDGWHANEGTTLAPCRFFHPEPFDLAEGTDADRRAVSITVEDAPASQIRDGYASDRIHDVREVDKRTVSGRDAFRIESLATGGGGRFPQGTRVVTHVVDDGARAVVIESTGLARDLDFEDAAAVQDRMVETLRLDAGGGEPGEGAEGESSDVGGESESGDPDEGPPALAQECTNPADGYTIGYPAGWHTKGEDGQTEPCGWFHPEPFELPQEQEVTDKAVSAYVDPIPFEDSRDPDDLATASVLVDEQRTVDGRRAVRTETVANGQGMYPEGTRHYSYRIDVGEGETMLVSTHSHVPEIDYEDAKAVVDRMVDSLRFHR